MNHPCPLSWTSWWLIIVSWYPIIGFMNTRTKTRNQTWWLDDAHAWHTVIFHTMNFDMLGSTSTLMGLWVDNRNMVVDGSRVMYHRKSGWDRKFGTNESLLEMQFFLIWLIKPNPDISARCCCCRSCRPPCPRSSSYCRRSNKRSYRWSAGKRLQFFSHTFDILPFPSIPCLQAPPSLLYNCRCGYFSIRSTISGWWWLTRIHPCRILLVIMPIVDIHGWYNSISHNH